MALLQVRNFPDDLYNKIKEKAKKEHRSIGKQVIAEIQNNNSEHPHKNIRQMTIIKAKSEFNKKSKKSQAIDWTEEIRKSRDGKDKYGHRF